MGMGKNFCPTQRTIACYSLTPWLDNTLRTDLHPTARRHPPTLGTDLLADMGCPPVAHSADDCSTEKQKEVGDTPL